MVYCELSCRLKIRSSLALRLLMTLLRLIFTCSLELHQYHACSTYNDICLYSWLCRKNLFTKRVAIPKLVTVFFPHVVLCIFAVMLTFSPQYIESVGKSVLFHCFILNITIFNQLCKHICPVYSLFLSWFVVFYLKLTNWFIFLLFFFSSCTTRLD